MSPDPIQSTDSSEIIPLLELERRTVDKTMKQLEGYLKDPNG